MLNQDLSVFYNSRNVTELKNFRQEISVKSLKQLNICIIWDSKLLCGFIHLLTLTARVTPMKVFKRVSVVLLIDLTQGLDIPRSYHVT